MNWLISVFSAVIAQGAAAARWVDGVLSAAEHH